MEKCVLSICIATHNRAAVIGETLSSIVPQLRPGTEVVVADGASTDATAEVVAAVARLYPAVRYVRLPRKGGIDHDYDQAVCLAAGEFCWLFSDDDILLPGAVQQVLRRIEEGHDLIVANAVVKDHTLTEILLENCMGTRASRAYASAELAELFVDTAQYLTFLGAVIIRRSLWLSRDRARYFGTEFVHLGVIFQERLPGSAFMIADALIAIRFGVAQWKARGFEVWMRKWPNLVWSLDAIPEAARASVVRREPWRSPRRLFYFRLFYDYSRRHFRTYLAGARAPAAAKAMMYLIACVPRAPARALILAGLTLIGKATPMRRYLLEGQAG